MATLASSSAPKPLARVLSTMDGGSENLSLFVAPFKPMVERTAKGRDLLKKAWPRADPNGNGWCSLAELDSFVKQTLIDAHGSARGQDLHALFRPSILPAFKDAADYKQDDGAVIAGTEGATRDDFVSKGEFRLFCAYAVVYASIYDGFSTIDGGGEGRAGDDRRISLTEWIHGYGSLAGHGFVAFEGITNDDTATVAFKAMDANGGGFVLLNEFCAYVKKAEIANDTALGGILAAEE